jgi:hypothetical protein
MTNDAEFVLAEVNRFRRSSWLGRTVLAAISAVQLFLAVPWLFGSSPLFGAETADLHLARDGALRISLALSGLAVAWRTRLAFFALPLVFVLMVVQTTFAFIDYFAEHVTSGFEWVHLLGAAIGVGIAMYVRPRGPRSQRPRGMRVVK